MLFRATIKKNQKLKLFAALFVLLIFTSCKNTAESPAVTPEVPAGKKYITVSGKVNINGAFPEEILNKLAVNEKSRTAFPIIPSSGFTYKIKAVNTSDNTEFYDGIPSSDFSSYTLSMPSPLTEKTFKIKVSVKLSSFETEYIFLKGESEEFSVNSETAVFSKNITLAPESDTGNGIINLAINVTGSGIKSGKAVIVFSDHEEGYITSVSDENVLSFQSGRHTEDELEDGISSGAWPITFNFYKTTDCSGEIIYSFSDVINVFNNMITNTWVQNGNEPWFTTTYASGRKTTACNITATMVEKFVLKEIFVDSSRTTDNPSAPSYTTQSGTFFNPCTTFSKAIEKLTDADRDYTIKIRGTVTGNQTIPSTLSKNGNDGKLYHAKSLTICGAAGLDESGNPQNSLNAGSSDRVLEITTDVPVIIKNLMITGGNAGTEYGGGIYINNSNANVYLADGTLVTGNQAYKGGGVFVNSGNLFIYGSAVIGKSGVTAHAEDADGCYGNKATLVGGGIGVWSGTVWLGYSAADTPAPTSGGVIYNLAKDTGETHGGGIDNSRGTVNIAAGSVSYNYACSTAGSTKTGFGGGISTAGTTNLSGTAVIEENVSDYGGGVFVTTDSRPGLLEMTGGTIRSNHAVKEHPDPGVGWGDGGGVAVGSRASFTMSGGTIISNTADCYGGAVANIAGISLQIKGSAYIPYDSENSCNDVYLASGKKITVSGDITPPSECTDGIVAAVTPAGYTIDTPLIELDTGVTDITLAEAAEHFAVISDATTPDKEWFINSDGQLYAWIGTKNPSVAKEVGDIVFYDGSSMTFPEFSALDDDGKNAVKPYAIAVIFYKGTGLNNDIAEDTPDTTTVRTLGVGLKQHSGLAWCKVSYFEDGATAAALSEELTTISCNRTSGDRDGSDNLEQIAEFLGSENDTGVGENSTKTEEEAAELYPAFYFAKNYKNVEGSNVSGTAYENGWYLPSTAEINQIYKQGISDNKVFDIDAVSQALGGDAFVSDVMYSPYYWTSSQYKVSGSNPISDAQLRTKSVIFNLSSGTIDTTYNMTSARSSTQRVCCIREF